MTASKLSAVLAVVILTTIPANAAKPLFSKGRLMELGTMIGSVSLCEDQVLIKRGQAYLLMRTFKASLDRASYKTLSASYALARRTHKMYIDREQKFYPFLMGACKSGEEFAANILSLRK